MRKTNLVKIVAMVTVLTLTAGNTTVLAAEEPQLYYDENGEECYTTVEITEEEEAEETAYDETDFDYREYVEETEEFIPFEDGEIYEEEVEEESEDDELFDDAEEYEIKDCGCVEGNYCPECDPDYIEESEEDIETGEEVLEMPSEEEDETFLYEKPCGCMVYTDIETFCDECDPEYEDEVEESSDDFEEVEEHVEENVKYVEEVDVVEVAANTKGYENEQKLFENSFGKEN